MKNLFEKSRRFLTSSRLKSLYWRTGAQFVAAFLDILLQRLTEWNPEAWQTIAIGLIIAEITKYLNTSSNVKKATNEK